LTDGGSSTRPEAIPRHIAVIMDGNGRWAEERGLPRTDGHRAGVDAVRKIVRAAQDIGVLAHALRLLDGELERPTRSTS
jgi:undecaprenyl diphosphate synthase